MAHACEGRRAALGEHSRTRKNAFREEVSTANNSRRKHIGRRATKGQEMQVDKKAYLEAPLGRPGLLVCVLAGLLAALISLTISLAPPADAAVAKGTVGKKDPATGFPRWYQDSNGLRLGLCLEGPPLCLEGLPNAGPASVPGNFPEEAFWWAGE